MPNDVANAHYVLLSGAGFSKNWGGLLASGVESYLLGVPDLDANVRNLLFEKRRFGGFEAALGTLQESSHTNEPSLRSMLEALEQMFRDMDKVFQSRTDFNFHNFREYQTTEFLGRFDVLFTLNQDLLLERFYSGAIETLSSRRWVGMEIPGMTPAGSDINGNQFLSTWRPLPNPKKTNPSCQPYYKLHGSSNWVDERSGMMMVMGGNKTKLLQQFDVLQNYHQEFANRLALPNTRLMVIGYSFRDDHINRAILAALEGGLKLFIIDPLGSSVLDKNRDLGNGTVYQADVLIQKAWPSLLGASSLQLRDIFRDGGMDFLSVMKFFDA